MLLTSVTVLVVSSDVTAIEVMSVIPLEDNAVSTAPLAARAPVRVVELRVIAVEVFPSRVFKFAAQQMYRQL